MGILMRTVEYPDLHHYKPEFNKDGTEKHIRLDGARFHVLSWGGGHDALGRMKSWCRCSEPNCEINKQLPQADSAK